MRKVLVSLLSIVMIGCATVGYNTSAPVSTNLSGFVGASGLVQQGEKCFLAATLRNGKSIQVPVDREICADATSALAVVNSVQQQQAQDAARAVAAMPKEEKK